MNDEKLTVVFDFDRTLTSTDTIKFLVVSLLAVRPLRILKALSFVFRFGLKGLFKSEHKHLLIGYLVKNRSSASVNKSLWLFTLIVQRCIRHDIQKILAKYLAQNSGVIIGTASPDFAVKNIFKNQSTVIVGSSYEVKEGMFTGTLLSPVCIGEEKLKRIKNVLKEKNLSEIDIAYSDHYSDLPLLRFAKRAVFVYPDNKTKEYFDKTKNEMIS